VSAGPLGIEWPVAQPKSVVSQKGHQERPALKNGKRALNVVELP